MFSTTTIASSTTKPTEMVSAISEMLSRLNPTRYITAMAPSSDSGTTRPGITVTRTLRKNSRITSTTSAMVRPKVNSTSPTEVRMVSVRSDKMSTVTAGGITACRRGSACLM